MLALVKLGTRIVVWVCSALFASLTALEALSRYATYHNRTYDLALYAREAWGLAHGDLWDPMLGAHFLGTHVAVVLWPLGLLGRLFGTVPVLLFAQALALGLATLPLSQIGARRFGDIGGLIAALLWLLYPNIAHVASYEFHPGSLAVLPLALALDALDRRAGWALVFSVLGMLTCRADLAVLVSMLGAMACFTPPLRRAGVVVTCLGLGYLALELLVLRAYWPAHNSFGLHFATWGGSPLGIVTALFTEPGLVLAHFAVPARALYLPSVLLPLLFLPLLAPRFALFALPALALNLISTFPTSTALYSHYLTLALPSLLVAALEGVAVLMRLAGRPWVAPLLLSWLLCAVLAASLQIGGLPWSRDYDHAAFVRSADSDEAARTVASIPPGASVQAPDALLAHLAERLRLYRSPPPDRGAQYVVLDIRHRVRFARQETVLRTSEEPATRNWLARLDYGLVYAEPTLLTLKRGQDPRAGLTQRYFPSASGSHFGVKLTGCLVATSAWLAPDGLELEFYARAPCPADLALRLGSSETAPRVDLLFDGWLSPAHLHDEYVMSFHPLTGSERTEIRAHGLFLGALRSSGAPPLPGDHRSVRVPLVQ